MTNRFGTRHSAYSMKHRLLFSILLTLVVATTPGCASFLPSSGPTRGNVEKVEKNNVSSGIQVLDVNRDLTQELLAARHNVTFAALALSEKDLATPSQVVGPGDVIEISIWETPPATLFSSSVTSPDGTTVQPGVTPTTFPAQQINAEGLVSVPFIGAVPVGGMTLRQIERTVQERLKGKANSPQVVVRRVINTSSTVTVVGEVNKSSLIPLTPKHERLLDVLAASEGVKQEVSKLTVQLTRGGHVYAMPLEEVIRDNTQNIYAHPGDVVTVLYQPLSFTALGATAKNAEISFEAKGINLAQALARVGGLQNALANAKGVFIFRYEPLDNLHWPNRPSVITPENTVPVVYRVDLSDASSFFAAQSFPIRDKDVLYVATAPSVQLSKFLSLLGQVVSPTMSTSVQVRTLTRE